MAEADKRRGNRKGLFYYLKAVKVDGGEPVGHLVNLTEGGLMLMSPVPIPPGTPLDLNLELPPPFEAHSPLRCQVLCRWGGPSVTPGFLDIGFEFSEPDAVRTQLIRRILREIGFTGNG